MTTTEQQETLLQTIQARLERNEKGSVDCIFDEQGPWKIIPSRATSGLITFFTPTYSIGIDACGLPKTKQL